MHQQSGHTLSPKLSQIEENKILAEIESMVGDTSYKIRRNDDAAATVGDRRERRRYSLVLFTALAVVVALVPAGLKRSDLLARAAHQATAN